jgi:hypothetical protein
MANLFAQLGEANDTISISRFIEAHRAMPSEVPLHEAEFWNPSQASFLRTAINDDADWAGVAENLNSALHAPN